MKKFMLVVLMAISFVSSGIAQNKTTGKKSKTTTTGTDTTKQTQVKQDPNKSTSRYDTQLIAVVTLKKDTLFFSDSEPICRTIKEVWDMKTYPDRPVILFVSNEQLHSVYNRVYGITIKGPVKN